MTFDRTRGAQAGDHNVQNNTYLPPQPDARHHSTSQSVTAGDNARITQKNTHLKFDVPLVGPLLSLAWAHPAIAGITAVAVLGAGGAAVNAALPDGDPSPSTTLVRGFVMKAKYGEAPVGYDFTHTPPVLADSGTDAIYVHQSSLVSTAGKLADWSPSEPPTAAGCRNAVKESPRREITIGTQSVVCYLDGNGDPGYITLTAWEGDSAVVDTAHLG
ncbi:hypothetical protein [Streptomyces sp. NPDC002588]|uniref:hypothetical protein n=1 Tax=Streptomyces sp. NPDC002588 TaxID=3154419 RepID=UPI00332CC2D5